MSEDMAMQVESSFGRPQFIKNGETMDGLDVIGTSLPPLKLKPLLGRYAWFESGIEQAYGPQLNKGLTLRLKNPKGAAAFPNLQGEFTFMQGSGEFTAVCLSKCMCEGADHPQAWIFDIKWTEPGIEQLGRLQHPPHAYVYVGTVLDDNGHPFLEVVFGSVKDTCVPYGYAKRQIGDEEPVGLSDAEKKRLNFLTNAEYHTLMDAIELKERKVIEEQLENKRLREMQQKGQLRREQEAAEEARKQREERMARDRERKAQGLSKAVRNKLRNQEYRLAAKRRKEERKIQEMQLQLELRQREEAEISRQRKADRRPLQGTTATRDEGRKRERELREEEARFDLLKKPSGVSSDSSSHTQQNTTIVAVKREVEKHLDLKPLLNPSVVVKREVDEHLDVKPRLNPSVKQETERPVQLDHRGTKRTHPGDHQDGNKRIKLGY